MSARYASALRSGAGGLEALDDDAEIPIEERQSFALAAGMTACAFGAAHQPDA